SMAAWAAPALCTMDPHSPHVDRFRAAVYRDDGTLVASVGDRPLAPLSAEDVARVHASKFWVGEGNLRVLPCPENVGGYLIVGPPPLRWGYMAFLFLCTGLVVALASLPFARSVVKPIERVVAVTSAFGRGDLGVRAADAVRGDEVGDLAKAFNE